MDQFSFLEFKKNIVNKLTGLLLDALEKGEIQRSEAQKMATFILDRKEKAEDKGSLILFLEELAKQWPMYASYVELQKKTEQTNSVDQEKLDQIKKQLIELGKTSH